MNHYLYKLNFVTPLHLGDTYSGGGLDRITSICHSDTFFSALCNEAASYSNGVDKLIQEAAKKNIRITDLFPYYDDQNNGDSFLYVPKPILSFPHENFHEELDKEQKNAVRRKKQKKIEYIRASEMNDYLIKARQGRIDLAELPEFGKEDILQKVNCRGEETLPYAVGAYSFKKDEINGIHAGLYFIAAIDNKELEEWFYKLLQSLGYTGIGGRRSSGYGKFDFSYDEHICIGEDGEYVGLYIDDEHLYNMLKNDDSSTQMLLSGLIPNAQDTDDVKKGTYKLLKRSGFVQSDSTSSAQKRNSVYMLASGSCFEKRVQGQMVKLNVTSVAHPIYRYGYGLYAGLFL